MSSNVIDGCDSEEDEASTELREEASIVLLDGLQPTISNTTQTVNSIARNGSLGTNLNLIVYLLQKEETVAMEFSQSHMIRV